MGMNSYGLYYNKTSLGLNILRNIVVGKKLFDYAFRSYTKEWAYKHPRPIDFFRRMNDATGMDLDWFWKEWFYKNWKLDQAITSVKKDSSNNYLITIENKDMMVMPVIARLWEANGDSVTKKLPVQIWQRGGTWTFKVKADSKVDSIKLDPDEQLPDINRSNNVWKSEAHKLEPAPEGETAQKVMNHYMKAIGGKKELKNVKDMTLNMTAQSQGYKVEITEKKKRPDKYSLVVKVPAIGRTVNSVKVNGNDVQVQDANGQNTELTDAQKALLKRSAIMFPELKYISGNYQTKLAGIKNNGGSKVYVVKVTGPNGVKKTIYYDVKSGLKTKAVTNNGPQPSTVKYSNYKSVNGVKIPYTYIITTGQSGANVKEKVQSAKINSGLKDSDFE
jgi:hypothetical protein